MKKELPPDLEERRLLTPDEAAERLAISTKHLRGLTQDGSIPYVNVGLGRRLESRRYDPKDIAAFIESRKQFAMRPELRIAPMVHHVQVKDFTAIRAERKAEKERKRRPTS